ncbi:hypothetical protein [Streptococcus sanguinis]|uniref:DUF3810 domain-containing protein n=1 Tax=Streptococcus sanguinis TaxID=1305 RepID=A0A7H8V008_STRSA|nr:hypothetical protein [Streptococcus sanguinis]QLB49979.1 DUF3810 domain-containing protein [Streptococcus sanguinis]
MKRWKFSIKVIWLVFYILLFIFVLLHFILSLFGLAFTPLLWNPWLFLLAALIFCHLWFLFFKNREFRWFHLLWGLLSVSPALFIWLTVFSYFSIIESENSVPINMDYKIEGSEVVLRKGYLLGEYDEYYDLVNPFIMKTKVNRVRYID